MKNKLTFLIVLLSFNHLQAQEFEFPLFFEDVFGDKDTIFLGYDMEATTGIDEAFGEINIKGTPLTGLDVRIIDYDYDNIYCEIEGNNDNSSFHTKKQIIDGNCDMPAFPALGIIIDKNRFPIKINWDKDIFPSTCGQGPILTDWYPGGWFDLPCDNTQEVVYMSTIDSVIFATTSLGVYIIEGDTVNYLFYNLVSGGVATEDWNQTDYVSIFPNPTNDKMEVSAEGFIDIMLYDITGNLLFFKENVYQNIELSLNDYPTGLYYVKIKKENRMVTKKVIKQ